MKKTIFTVLLAKMLCMSALLTACNDAPGVVDETTNRQSPASDSTVTVSDTSAAKKIYAMEDKEDIYYSGLLGKTNYRIPSMVTTDNGVVITAIDRGHGPDSGDISLAVRRSTDGGKSWLDPQILIDLPYGAPESVAAGYEALTIDMSMVYDKKTDRTYLFTSVFPESKANMDTSIIETGTGYKTVNGEARLMLRNYRGSVIDKKYTDEYTVGADGTVYDASGNKTEYTLPSFIDGTLFKNGKSAGNIFLYTGDNAGELSVPSTHYFIMIYSDDDGATWSEAKCLNASLKPDNVKTFGVGPGIGIQLESGRLVIPCWCPAGTCVIYSDDHGESWKRGGYVVGRSALNEAQLVELNDKNGKKILKMFCRASKHPYITTSVDGGETWKKIYSDTELFCPDCQLTVIALPVELPGYEGRQAVIYSGPYSENLRMNGTLWLGIYNEDSDTFKWINKKTFTITSHMYSCLSVLPDDRIGILYEVSTKQTVFSAFQIGYLLP